MLFNSIEFIAVFLPIAWCIFMVLGRYTSRLAAIAWLVSASLFFYGWWNPKYLLLILVSICFNYLIGKRLSNLQNTKGRKAILLSAVAVNLIALGYFKYANFFIDNLNLVAGTDYSLGQIFLPLAISFFTFQQIAYLVDAYEGEFADCNFLQYCIFVTFFPQLIAGPIVHHKEVLPQFANSDFLKFSADNTADGLTYFLIGLFKKVVLADSLSKFVGPTFAAADSGNEISFFVAWAAALTYTFQLYFDFSGYSDMAIGIGKLFNIHLPVNFFSPYKATNIIDFWRRWHITLSCFLRDYLYIPLGGNRYGLARRYINLMLTMVIGGLWHGANWTFVIWGTLHGLYLVINHGFRKLRKHLGQENLDQPSWAWTSVSRMITFVAVVVGWVVFRSETFIGAKNILSGMAGLKGYTLPNQIANLLPSFAQQFVHTVGSMPLLGGGTIVGVIEMTGLIALSFFLVCMPASQEQGPKLKAVSLLLCGYFVIQAVFFSRSPSEFLYFQF